MIQSCGFPQKADEESDMKTLEPDHKSEPTKPDPPILPAVKSLLKNVLVPAMVKNYIALHAVDTAANETKDGRQPESKRHKRSA